MKITFFDIPRLPYSRTDYHFDCIFDKVAAAIVASHAYPFSFVQSDHWRMILRVTWLPLMWLICYRILGCVISRLRDAGISPYWAGLLIPAMLPPPLRWLLPGVAYTKFVLLFHVAEWWPGQSIPALCFVIPAICLLIVGMFAPSKIASIEDAPEEGAAHDRTDMPRLGL